MQNSLFVLTWYDSRVLQRRFANVTLGEEDLNAFKFSCLFKFSSNEVTVYIDLCY